MTISNYFQRLYLAASSVEGWEALRLAEELCAEHAAKDDSFWHRFLAEAPALDVSSEEGRRDLSEWLWSWDK